MRSIFAPILLALCAPPALAVDTLKVPSDFADIPAAVAAAAPGDTIVVGAGTHEPFELDSVVGVTLRTQGKVVIDAGAAASAIRVSNCEDVLLRGFRVANATDRGIVVMDSTGVTLERCRVEDAATEPGDAVLLVGIEATGCTELLVTRALVSNARERGIALVDCADAAIEKCRVLDGWNDAIVIENGHGLRVERNLVDGAVNTAILVETPAGDAGDGSVSAGADDSTFLRNMIRDTDDDGLVIAGTNNLVERNTVRNGGWQGFDALEACTGTTFRKNKVISCWDNGFKLAGSGNTIEDLLLKTPGDEGLEIEGSDNTVRKVRILKPDDNGLLLENSASGNLVESVKVVRAGSEPEGTTQRDGIRVEGTGNTLRTCTTSKADTDGWFVAGSGNVIEDGKAAGSGENGFHVTGSDNAFIDCKSSGSAQEGLLDPAGASTTNTYDGCTFG